MPSRVIAIGDIHGCAKALEAVIQAISPDRTDTIVTLGDYIDRGPDSRGVIEQLLSLAERCRIVPLLGNHEEVMLEALDDFTKLKRWLTLGGADRLRSYGWKIGGPRRPLTDWVPDRHHQFLRCCRPFFDTPTHFFAHAGYEPSLSLEEQPDLALKWRVTDAANATPHISGKIAVVGHTPQLSGEILDLGFLKCIDTACVRGGWLTALETISGSVWQASLSGSLR